MPLMSSYFWFAQLVTAATVTVATFLAHTLAPINDPAPFYLGAVVYAAWLGGTAAGLGSAALTVASAALLYSHPSALVTGNSGALSRTIVFALASSFIAGVVGAMRAQATAASTRERKNKEANRHAGSELANLRAALDHVEHGVVLLDTDQRTQAVNSAFRKLWQLPDAVADDKLALVELLHRGDRTAARSMAANEMEAFVAERAVPTKSGGKPLDLHLANGDLLRIGCAPLPKGRMLTCTNLTDLVRRADELQQLAHTDSLTGLLNRHRFKTLTTAEWYRYQRYKRPLSYIAVNIDRLALVNDRLGRAAGDEVIAKIAAMWREGKRASDILARVGGQEFALLLPETALHEAIGVAERLRQEIARFPLRFGDVAVPVTVSVGVAEAEPGMQRADELIDRAEQALTATKRAGRSRPVNASAPVAQKQIA